jgi:MFS family permease
MKLSVITESPPRKPPVKPPSRSLLYVAAAFGSLAGGWLQERFSLGRVLAGLFLVCSVGMAGHLVSPTLPYTVGFAICYGFSFGGVTTLTYVMWPAYYGRDNAGSIAGAAQPLQFVLGAVFPVYGGWVYDQTGSYGAAFAAWSVALAVGALAAFTARVPVRPGTRT